MSGELLNRLLGDELARRRDAQLLRTRQPLRYLDSTHVELEGVRYVNFASNNYLGLTHHPRVVSAVQEHVRRCGTGSAASPLITGYTDQHAQAEQDIAAWKGTEAAVLLPSGYQSAQAAIQTLAALGQRDSGGVRFLLDRLAHASLIDSVRGTGARYRVFPHNNLAKLHRLLSERARGELQVVVTESIFSMDGDAADLEGLAHLKERQPFVLLLDEAHGSGVYGPGGSGYAAERGLQAAVDVSIVTLSKAIGICGGAVCGTRLFCEGLVNWGRPYVYSTSLAPAVAAGAQAAIEVMASEPGRQQRLRLLAARVRQALTSAGVEIPPGDSPIIPILLGHERNAMEAARRMRQDGLLVVAVRPPTVPRGTSRLRVTLSCDHSDQEVQRLIQALCAVVAGT